MKPSTDQLITWFFTASVAAEMHAPGAEASYRDAIAKLKGKARSGVASGLKQGVNDLLHIADMWTPEKYKAVEGALAAAGLPSLKKMQITLSKKHVGILKRGTIRNEEEYYNVTELLGDVSSELTSIEREQLGVMTVEYENKPKTA